MRRRDDQIAQGAAEPGDQQGRADHHLHRARRQTQHDGRADHGAQDRGHVHDRTTAAGAQHGFDLVFHAIENARQIDLDHAVPVVDGERRGRSADGDAGVAYERRLDLVIDRIERLALPTIAEVDGAAVGGGCAGAFTGVVFAEVSARVPDSQRGRALGWVMSGHSLTLARKLPMVFGLLLSSSLVLCIFVESDTAVVALMALAFFGKGLGSLGWTLVADTSPRQILGLSGGLFNTFGNLAAITTPIVIGYLVSLTGSFDGALAYVGLNALLAVVSFGLIVGQIRRVELDEGASGSTSGSAS